MGCQVINDPNLGTMIICSRGRKSTAKCFYCGKPAPYLCDYPVATNKSGTCDKKICGSCSINVGNDTDHCKQHTSKVIGTITVGNYKLGDRGIYVGRAMSRYKLSQSPLANQWKLGSLASAEQILPTYREWLYKEIKARGDAWLELCRIRDLILNGQNVVLVCWCKPSACHGDIVKNALLWMIKQIS